MHKRRALDVNKLVLSAYTVEVEEYEVFVQFQAPKESLYHPGMYRIRIELPEEYPLKSPSVGFVTRIFHPNVDERSGSICLDVLNQTWSPMFDLLNIVDVFLPQLLLYPNPQDPLNSEAATLLLQRPKLYARRVREFVRLYSLQPDSQDIPPSPGHIERADLSELSDTSELDVDLI